MLRRLSTIVVGAAVAAGASPALALPEIISLGNGTPLSVTTSISGTNTVMGSGLGTTQAVRWSLTGATLSAAVIPGTGSGGGYVSADGAYAVVVIPNSSPQIFGNTATGVTPPFSTTPTLVPSTTQPPTSEFRAARLNLATNTLQDMGGLPIVPSLMVYGSGAGSFMIPTGISATGRFIIGRGYISSYNSAAGTTISASTSQWRPWIWDADANAGAGGFTVLSTPFRTSSNTWRRRTGMPYAVSANGTVIVGVQEHSNATTPTADPDGGRLVVWRFNSGSGEYDMTYLPNGVNESGFPYTYSSTAGTVHMNQAGTIIVAPAVDDSGFGFLGKWTWDAGTSTWSNPANLGSDLAVDASWLPSIVTTCGLPPQITPLGMSDDGNTIIGSARYSTCGSFMSAGFIWTASSGVMTDWYDYCVAQGIAGITTDYSPIDINGLPVLIGLPRLGSPIGISADGTAIVGQVLGPQVIPGAPPWLMLMTGGPGCVSPLVTSNPTTPTNYSACTSQIILNTSAGGTLPIAYQWYKDGSPLSDGLTPSGSTISGATSYQLRVSPPFTPSDAGSYQAVMTGPCGAPLPGSAATVQIDAAFVTPAVNDTCLTAQTVSAGTNVLTPAQSPCNAYTMDPLNGASCAFSGTKTDRWYVFTPGATGDFRLETCGSNFDTVISVYDSCGGAELACNDNYETGSSTGCASSRSRIAVITLTGGLPYYIRISAPLTVFLSSSSTMNLSIIAPPTPAPNDNCDDAIPAVVGVNALNTNEATNDWLSSCNTAAGRDVWFTFTPVGTGKLTLATCPGTSWNTVMSLHDSCFGSELACNDEANVSGCFSQSIISNYSVQSGSTYYIRVGGNSATAFGAGQLTVTLHRIGDVNCDGNVDFFDIDPYLLALFDPASYATAFPNCYLLSADLDESGAVDFFDIDPFLDCLFNATCP